MDPKDKDWKQEQDRVGRVKEVITAKQKKFEGSTSNLKEDIIDLRKKFWDDVTVNIDEPDDVIETYASIKQQAELLSERERSHGQYFKSAKLLERMKSSPYFGRFDFAEEDNSTESFYIGIASLMDEKEEEFLVYDWRAPVSSLYYDYSPGPVQYQTPEDNIEGEMTLKRQYIIQNGFIQGMFNTGITIGDSLLQKVLGGQATSQMKSIVATIQKEQNSIIRNENSRLLIVQGVAGSGKTSVAMQRIAYLLYQHRKQITADQILLFSPNQMFSSYVASVLPELGEENMQQSTYYEYVQKRLDQEYTLESPFQQVEEALTSRRKDASHLLEEMVRFKSSIEFKQLLDDYIESLAKEGLIFRNIKFRKKIKITAKEIYNYFYQLNAQMSIPNRLELVKEWILKKLKEIESEEIEKDWPEEAAALLDKGDYMSAYQKLEQKQKLHEETFNDSIQEEQFLRSLVVKRKLAPLRKQVKQFRFMNIRKMYKQLFDQNLASLNLPDHWAFFAEKTLENLAAYYLPVEDQTAYLYLTDRLEGKKMNTDIRYVFIDEAQDYSAFQYSYIKEMFPSAHFTLLGDVHQSIFTHNEDDSTVLAEGWHQDQAVKQELLRSYRSTEPIVEFTKMLLEDGKKIEAFNRGGECPQIYHSDSADAQLDMIEKVARIRLSQGFETVAILCQTIGECRAVHSYLNEDLQAGLIYKETQPFQTGLVILPVYLAKGIEFESVLVYNASADIYYKKEDRLMLYTACTRAMHVLDVFYQNEPSPFIEMVPKNKYEKKTAVQL